MALCKILPVVLLLLVPVVDAKPSRVKRVVGGYQYPAGEYPYSVSLWYLGDNNIYTSNTSDRLHTCGGVLIEDRWVLTSAACFDDNFIEGTGNLSLWKVVLGMYNQVNAEDDAQVMTAEQVFHLPEYNLTDGYGDLALLKLSRRANLNDPLIGLIDFNSDPQCPETGQDCTVIGWGQVAEEPYGNGSYVPHAAEVNAVATFDCKQTYRQPDVMLHIGYIRFAEGSLCAGVPEGGRDACFGDSGSPLVCHCEGEFKVVATVSSGYGCARPGFPGIYARVSPYADWILKTMQENTDDK